MNLVKLLNKNYSKKELKRINPILEQVLSFEESMSKLSDAELKNMTDEFKARLNDGADIDSILPEAFAVCREAAWRVLGMKHFPVQIIGGIVLHQGRIAEMKTGEGKTLVATLPAYLNALTGKGVHIVTVNDYLARRDSEWMGKIYRFLGLSVGLVVNGMSGDERREAYNADITYGTNNELGFDYLRDNMVIYKEQKVQRGHAFAIVDEVDSILIDEARTPLIISGRGEESTELYSKADRFVRGLKKCVVREMNSKEDDEQANYDGDYVVDEKAKTAVLTKSGIQKAEKYFNVENLNDPENMQLNHNINQAIKAHGVMKLDVDYVVKDGEVIIVDEFTGRLMFGRRYNEGLHQAIEAKEGVKVAHESKTLATITFQNYFRLYEKLSGMTGTALTEETEFREIYKLDVIEIPTNKPLIREDLTDQIYKTEVAKFNAVIDKIVECHQKGQPVLVGTISIEKSELLSKMLSKRGIKHQILNAKHHDKEAMIVAQAGKKGAVTIATNMAGRGTDIMLGGNAEYLAKAEMAKLGFTEFQISEATGFGDTEDKDILAAREKFNELNLKYKEQIAPEAQEVKDAGGLCILGTERHESRRIDNQLRGRAGRQGDPGQTRFYISLEDDLMRLFGGERIYNMMDMLKVDETQPLEMKMLSNSIESAQERVELKNFSARKSVIEFDDVMNVQRGIIYKQRDDVLNGEDMSDTVKKMILRSIETNVDLFTSGEPENWNLKGLRDQYLGWLTTEDDLNYSARELDEIDEKDIVDTLYQKAMQIYNKNIEQYGEALMNDVERNILLRTVDRNWMEHIDAMEELKRGIHLRGYGQHDPVNEYRNDGGDMFDAMISAIQEETAKAILCVKIKTGDEIKREQVSKAEKFTNGQSDKGTVSAKPKGPSKNGLCPCGSGKKYKRCCGKNEQ
ncbi:MAG: preprotein translocase subunit SecA [Acutalibacteraceae bacterium]|nr:preprotein translocase subunit SecA [Acutalibacteraceae bacterium]